MNNKKFILNADDFGISKSINKAVLSAYNDGFLTSTSLCANGCAFDSAINEILPECPNLGIGAHLNIIEGKALTKCSHLTNQNGEFNKGFIQLLLKSNDKEFLSDVEKEFRAQIERIASHTKIDHLDSHVHTHSIPNIFKIVAKLAKEYEIPYVRTQYEDIYFVPSILKHVNFKYPINLIKIILLNNFSINNKKVLKEYDLKTNDFIIGVGYTGLMDSSTIEHGLTSINEDCIVEALIHPCFQTKKINNQHYTEYMITQDKELKDKIQRMGFEITNYKSL